MRHGALLALKLWSTDVSTFFCEFGICAGMAESETAHSMIFVDEHSSFAFEDLILQSIDNVVSLSSDA